MKTVLRLAVLALAGTSALALAGNALAAQKLSVRQTATSLTIKVSQAQTDNQPAKISDLRPGRLHDQHIGGARDEDRHDDRHGLRARRRTSRCRSPATSSPCRRRQTRPGATRCRTSRCGTCRCLVAGQTINLPVHVDQVTGAETALGGQKLVVCLAPSDVPQGTPGRSPFGAQLLDATFTVENVFTVPVGQAVWKAITTPYNTGTGTPNVAGTVETRSFVSNGAVTITTSVTNKARRVVRLAGRVSQGGSGVVGAQVTILVNGKGSFRKRTTANGAYSLVLKKTGKKTTTTFQSRVTVAERTITPTGCASPSLPGVPCVTAHELAVHGGQPQGPSPHLGPTAYRDGADRAPSRMLGPWPRFASAPAPGPTRRSRSTGIRRASLRANGSPITPSTSTPSRSTRPTTACRPSRWSPSGRNARRTTSSCTSRRSG